MAQPNPSAADDRPGPEGPFEGYPFESRYLDLEGVRMHYLDEGEGPLVVMVHGNPTWSYAWRRLVLALRGDHRVLVPDHIGCGLSDKPDDGRYPYRLARRIDDLERLIDQTAPEGDVILVVHDWGGMIGMGWAARHPERVARLVILNTAAFPLPEAAQVPRSLKFARSSLGAFLVRGLNLFCRGALARCATQHTFTPGERRAYLAPYDSWAHRIAVHRFIQDIPLGPNEPSWAAVKETEAGLAHFQATPALVLWGMRDFVFTPAFLAEWERRLPHARFERFESAGHYLFEDEADAVRERVVGFLAEARAAEPA